MQKQAFVTGGSGHVGANLVRLLLKRGWSVRCLSHNDIRAFEKLKVEIVQGDMLNETFLKNQMQDCYAVFHAAAVIGLENINKREMDRVNIQGTRAMCNAALLSKVKRFVFFSSIHAFQQEPLDKLITEERPLVRGQKVSYYDLTKAKAELEVKKAHQKGLHTIVLNPTGILGPHDFKPSRMGQLILSMMKQRIPLTINAGFNWVDVRDVCSIAIDSLDKTKPGNNYILSGMWVSFRELGDIISLKINKKTKWASLPFWTAYLFLPFSFLYSKIFSKRRLFSSGSLRALAIQAEPSNEKAKKTLGFNPRPIQETITDTIEWMIKKDVR